MEAPNPCPICGSSERRDALGRDVLSRVLFAYRVSLGVAVGSVVVALAAGVPIGLLAGFYGGWVDTLLMRPVDLLLALPLPAVVPLHPRTRARLEASGMLAELEAAEHVRLQPPLGYLAFTALLVRAQAMLTDSGGVQKEAYLAGIPCVTMRDTTEWVETVEAGWNVLVDLDRDAALAALARPVPAERPELYGDGRAGERVVAALERAFAPR